MSAFNRRAAQAAIAFACALAPAPSLLAEPPAASPGMVQRAEPTMRQNPPASPPALPPVLDERVLRAQANLQALWQGRLFVSDLSPQAMQDVIDLDRMLRGQRADNRTFAQHASTTKCAAPEASRPASRGR
ncbi:hypothetical protein [Porphyrobacter sp. LM 6]|uniref:hypothetical protein n=1 Tax=Porphyrobacter sp. LM 6 TaxID=1896196 RepID=UPI00084642AB|nr:hypothetical protein [Porphyrobacter sp. LM 6]AOL93629.1 hypothetical protein BG023_11676 [Porphyrobacter sp. LM 6]